MNSVNGVTGSLSVLPLEAPALTTSPPLLGSGAIKDPLSSISMGASSASGVGDAVALGLAAPLAIGSGAASVTVPTLQIEVAPEDMMQLGLDAQTLLPIPQTFPEGAPGLPTPLPPPITGEVVFIDPSLPNYQSLVAGVREGVTVIVLDPRRDGIAQITQALAQAQAISAIHIVSPGDAGVLKLGMSQLTTRSLDLYQASFAQWKTALTPEADILLYASEVGAGSAGDLFTQKLSQLTAADIAASTNRTGNAALGGDWTLEKTVLEVNTGAIAAQLAFQTSLTSTYAAVFDLSTSRST